MKARGTVFLAESKNEIASHYFERAQRSDPKDARVLIGLGMVSSRKGDTRKAHEMFANALRLSPDTTVGIMQLVGTSYALEEFGDLERCLRQYLHLKPEEIEMQYCLAGCLLRTGGVAESESICVGILKRDPNHKNARELLDIIHARHPQMAEVVTTSIAAGPTVESKPRLVEVDTILGKLEEHKRRKEYDQLSAGVIELLARTDLVNDQRELALCLKAESLVMDDDIAGAERTFQEVLELNANSPRGLSGKAVLKAHLGSWMEAQNLFERARSLKEDYDLALAGLGICALQANDLETAWARFSAALKSNPENTRALLGLVQLAYPMKRFEELELAIRSYLDIHSADLEWVYSLAGVCFAQGKLDEAQNAVEQIKLFRPNDAKANELAQMIEQRR
jgi:tetratricopeptide (TPR) repeat protein